MKKVRRTLNTDQATRSAAPGSGMQKAVGIAILAVLVGATAYFVVTVRQMWHRFLIEDSIHHSYYPLVDALRHYTEDQSNAPALLNELIPDYLSELPDSEFVGKVEYEGQGDGWLLTLHSDATGEPRIYQTREPNFTDEEIAESYLFYHSTWLVKTGEQE